MLDSFAVTALPANPPARATPILDRLTPLPSAASARLRVPQETLIGLGTVLLLAVLLLHPAVARLAQAWLARIVASVPRGLTPGWAAWAAFSLVAAFVAVVAIHECAHLVVGSAVGFGIHSIRVGRIQFEPPARFSLYRGPGVGSGGWTGGWVNLIPSRADHLVPRAIAMVFAGPASNLATAAAALLLPVPQTLFWGMFVLNSCILGLVNLLPFRNQAIESDGARILMLLRSRARGERWLAVMRLGAELHQGRMPESLSPEFIVKAVAVRDASPDTVAAHVLLYASAFHRHADDEAAQALETCLAYSAHAMPAVREALPCDAAIFQARRRQRPDLAEQWLALIPERAQIPALRTRAEAAILETRGEYAAALRKLEESEQALEALANPLQRELTLRLLRRWKEEVGKRLPAGVTR